MSEATVKVHVGGDRFIETAEGNGPVNALDKALRMAIERRFPEVHDIHLVNYRVRILDEDRGTAATTRVHHRLVRRARLAGAAWEWG